MQTPSVDEGWEMCSNCKSVITMWKMHPKQELRSQDVCSAGLSTIKPKHISALWRAKYGRNSIILQIPVSATKRGLGQTFLSVSSSMLWGKQNVIKLKRKKCSHSAIQISLDKPSFVEAPVFILNQCFPSFHSLYKPLFS